jgi:hypothetical protein
MTMKKIMIRPCLQLERRIGRANFQHARLDVELVVRADVVRVVPEPHVAVDLDVHDLFFARLLRQNVLFVEQREGALGDPHEDQHRHDGPENFDKRVVREFLRHRVRTLVVADHHPDQQRRDEDGDHRDDDQDLAVERLNVLRRLRCRSLEVDTPSMRRSPGGTAGYEAGGAKRQKLPSTAHIYLTSSSQMRETGALT